MRAGGACGGSVAKFLFFLAGGVRDWVDGACSMAKMVVRACMRGERTGCGKMVAGCWEREVEMFVLSTH